MLIPGGSLSLKVIHLDLEVRLRKHIFLLVFVMALSSAGWPADKHTEEQTARYLDSVRHDPLRLLSFVQQMPKGGDLHNHLSGAVYAETFIQFAVADKMCFDRSRGRLVQSNSQPCDPSQGRPNVEDAYKDGVLFGDMVDAFSMRDFHPHCDFV